MRTWEFRAKRDCWGSVRVTLGRTNTIHIKGENVKRPPRRAEHSDKCQRKRMTGHVAVHEDVRDRGIFLASYTSRD